MHEHFIDDNIYLAPLCQLSEKCWPAISEAGYNPYKEALFENNQYIV